MFSAIIHIIKGHNLNILNNKIVDIKFSAHNTFLE